VVEDEAAAGELQVGDLRATDTAQHRARSASSTPVPSCTPSPSSSAGSATTRSSSSSPSPVRLLALLSSFLAKATPTRSPFRAPAALSTLDLLKKAPNPLHDLARDATRFLETQLDISRQIHAAFSAADADARTRVRPQAQGEELAWAEVERLFVVPDDWVVELPAGVELPPPYRRDDADENGQEPEPLPLPTANDIPVHLRSTLQCILYFHLRVPPAPSPSSSASPSSSSASTTSLPPVAITFNSDLSTPAPLAAPLAKLLASSTSSPSTAPGSAPSSPRKRRPDKPEPDYLALSSGDALAYYLEIFFPSVSRSGGGGGGKVLAPVAQDEVERARAWWRAQAQARQQAQGQGQGEREGGGAPGRGGRGGRGGGARGGGGPGRGGRAGRGGGKSGAGAEAGPGDAPKSLYVP